MTRLPLALLLLTTIQAQAQDRPLALPTRDVDVTYRSEHGNVVFEQRSRFEAATKRMRLDMPTKGVYMIVDYKTKRMAIVTEAEHAVLEGAAPAGLPGPALTSASPVEGFLRQGTDQVAGNACIEWETRDIRKQPVQTCFTGDGVLLRARRGTTVLAVATQVNYGRLDPTLFDVPPGYQHLELRADKP